MKTQRFKLKPTRPGLIVRDPVTMKPLPEDGSIKPMNSYWLRRIREGSAVEVVETPAVDSEKKKSSKVDSKKGEDK